ncbi:hypothetical protein C5167_013221 [Papaver somniferum]|uniref:non-specific serine/threonine protein kinase n=1 Tax=Papaver somniferum TaxID=3469 RepID=A0A4Y7J3Q8_PAPSO|nr:hypothetical protein C5167_013221 [Papaver somniferum]
MRLLSLHVISNRKFSVIILVLLIVLNYLEEFSFEAQVLPEDEVFAANHNESQGFENYLSNLQRKTSMVRNVVLQIVDLPCHKRLEPCPEVVGPFSNPIHICTSTVNILVCKANCELKRLYLSGELPDEFANLPYLQELDLTVNYLYGSIPKAWKTLPLVNLSLLANNVKGMIPNEIAEIITLEYLLLTDNQLEGPIPPELGKLTRLKGLALSGNNFTGTLPATFANLKDMIDLIAGTNFSGKIPDFIGNWTKLLRLDMRGTSMEGPIPSTIFRLKNLTTLRISDLKGPNMPFPDLRDMNSMQLLELRNCLIYGSIPSNIVEIMPGLKKLDLSFNGLTGDIQSLQEIPSLQNMYLTNNSLTGQTPAWITNAKRNFDLSYNNFTGPSQSGIKSRVIHQQKTTHYSFFINCGGLEMTVGGEKYDADLSPMGPSSFFFYNDNWACSNTGDFVGSTRANYFTQASTNMSVTGLYSTARISPLSLKYYGLCLRPGNYKVKLHFAEIMFPIDQTADGIGTRVFDVSIQGKKVLKDFNIEVAAKGVGKSVIKEYDVDVTNSTLEIHLYWAGKGTTLIPSDIAYGPLISAIAVTPNFDPNKGRVSVGIIAGVIAASCFLILLILAILWKKGFIGKNNLEDKELKELLQTSYFTLREIKAATSNFDSANKIGEGGFGPVYKGVRPDGSVIAVKQLSAKSMQGNREFVNEINMISAIQHRNLVKLFGCCVERNQLLVIYEYMENNSLARALFGKLHIASVFSLLRGCADQRLNLNWPTRHGICLDIAKGLAYLHEESRLKIVHRDIKATNVLLDKDFTARISDFGLAKLDEEEKTHISTRIAGTVLHATTFSINFFDVSMAYVLKEEGNLLDLVDPSLESNYSLEEVLSMSNIALLCTNPSPSLRPLMSTVVSMLEGRTSVPESLAKIPVQESRVISGGPRADDTRSWTSGGISSGVVVIESRYMDMKLISHVISNKHFSFLILLSFIVLNCLEEFISDAYILPEDEELPDEFANLPYLQEIDLNVNYLSGSIPKAWKTLPLVNLAMLANNIGGSIPKEIAEIVTLQHLVLQDNQFEGPLPPELGKLTRLTQLALSGNNFTGVLPETFANLKNMADFRIAGTSISGKIPDFFGNWTQLIDLRVSDLKGQNTPFPDFQDMNRMSELELRNCLIKGLIPSNIGEMMPGLTRLDLSYNNFTGPSQSGCQDSNLNKISSYTSDEDRSIAWCLKKDLPCGTKSKYYSFFINCGGSEMAIGDNKYDADVSPMGPSSFYSYNDKWACSTTGDFIVPLLKGKPNYLTQASPNITVTGLYMTARISPLSLKYYGICLHPGNYKVKLHFAEIMFPIGKTAAGIGTRLFDVSIQGKRYLKDFNIEEEAKGVGKSIIKEYDVDVTNSTLEIHLYWAGKGTNFIPSDFAYGPLISAIAVTPNFIGQIKADSEPNRGHISVGVLVGTVAASCVLILLILAILWKKGCLGKKNKELRELSQRGGFTLREIETATWNFAYKIGEGGFGPVYKGQLPDGSQIAVKQLSAMSNQGSREFVNEIGIISGLQHPNLVKLFGCCVEENQLLVIYEYMENNSLARALYGKAGERLNLNWPTRLRICSDIAEGLAYLHEESRLKIVHRDIKATNVLLDKYFTARISDFGLAKLDVEENTHISTRVAGTLGYMAPEYAISGHLTYKADIYSFGVVVLEIVSGKKNTKYRPNDECTCLLDWANVLKEQGRLLDLIDPILESNYSKSEVLRVLNIGILCTNPSAVLRPKMSTVVAMLDGRLPVRESCVVRGPRTDNSRSSASEGTSYDSRTHTSTSSRGSTLLEMSNSSVEDPRQVTLSTYYSMKKEEEEEIREHSSG